MLLETRPHRGRSRPLDPAEERVARLVLIRRGVHGPDLEDSLQEVRIRVLRFAPSDEQLCSWLGQVASNVAIDHHRAARRRRVLHATLGSRTLTAIHMDADPTLRPVVTAALRNLGPEHREVLALRVLAGLSLRETASRLGIPEGTVKSRLHRALTALRPVLVDDEGLAWSA